VDRLGRSLRDLLAFLEAIHGANVDLFLHQQGLDTTSPAGRAMFQMLGIFAEFERSVVVARVHAGLARARTTGTKSGKPFGRPKVGTAVERKVRELHRQGLGMIKIGKQLGCGTGSVSASWRSVLPDSERASGPIVCRPPFSPCAGRRCRRSLPPW
jgi:DNA invertase Pin-like site-specific DNA recombinase